VQNQKLLKSLPRQGKGFEKMPRGFALKKSEAAAAAARQDSGA